MQKFNENADAAFEITGKGGVQLKFPAGSLLDKDGQPVSGPVNLKLIEIFNKKDVLLSGIDTESYGSLLETGGQIFVEAEQNGNKLKLNPNNYYEFRLPELSWINIDRFINDGKAKTNISVTLDGSQATGNVNIEIWIVFKNIKSAFKLPGLTTVGGNYANLLPLGEEIKLAIVAVNQHGQMYIDSRDLTTEDNKTYTLTPRPVTQAEMDVFILSLE